MRKKLGFGSLGADDIYGPSLPPEYMVPLTPAPQTDTSAGSSSLKDVVIWGSIGAAVLVSLYLFGKHEVKTTGKDLYEKAASAAKGASKRARLAMQAIEGEPS